MEFNRTVLRAGEEDFCFIDIAVTDCVGTLKLLPERKIYIKVEGAGTLQGFGSANHLNEEKFNHLHHATYLGRLQAVIRSGKDSGVHGLSLGKTLTCSGFRDNVNPVFAQWFTLCVRWLADKLGDFAIN